tara:strand:+ start:355 stop:870 length:516 start_codon:yes stop_codon:yes gene_type:complete
MNTITAPETIEGDYLICECSVPKFIIENGTKKCSICKLTDHYKSGSDDELTTEPSFFGACNYCEKEVWVGGDSGYGCVCYKCKVIWEPSPEDEEEEEDEDEIRRIEYCCKKCYLIECCCEADKLQVIKDDERAKADGYVENEDGRWIKNQATVIPARIQALCGMSRRFTNL